MAVLTGQKLAHYDSDSMARSRVTDGQYCTLCGKGCESCLWEMYSTADRILVLISTDRRVRRVK